MVDAEIGFSIARNTWFERGNAISVVYAAIGFSITCDAFSERGGVDAPCTIAN